MEEEKAVAYYDELTRKGEGAARFKRGLGFSSGNDAVPLKSSSSFLSNFVKASSPPQTSSPPRTSHLEKQAQLETIQNKLKKKSRDEPPRSERSIRESSHRRHGSRSRERDDRNGASYSSKSKRSRSRSRERRRNRERDRERERDRDRRRSRSRGWSPLKEWRSERRRSLSPRRRSKRDTEKEGKERNGGVDYSRLIDGYDKMTPSEKVKARMKFQLDETAERDGEKGMSSGWERFEFDKDAPLDDEEIEAAEDDTTLVKHIGQSFRFSAVEARREDQIKAAHDEAMFGAPVLSSSIKTSSEPEMAIIGGENSGSGLAASLLSEKVLAKQQGSWRDRARKV